MRSVSRSLGFVCIAAAWLFAPVICGGCAPSRNPLPEYLIEKARVPGLPLAIRDWGDAPSGRFQADLAHAFSSRGGPADVEILALSGGGADGAYGAGLLVGWSEAGTRPEFTIVTGISTGALTAPFVFAGEQYDPKLREMYTTVSDADVFRYKGLLRLLGGADSLADNTPLKRLIAQSVDDDLIAVIAEGHRAGRRLYVGTTNLDARRLVGWNMGAIAATGTPEAKQLFRQVLVASASVPVAFPPEYIEVAAEGGLYDEMHTDGGGTTQVFYPGFMVDLPAAAREAGWSESWRARLYIVQNVQINGGYRAIEPDLFAIAERMLSSLLATQGRSDLLRIHQAATDQGMDAAYATFPSDFLRTGSGTFNPEDMTRLFELGAQQARAGNPWRPAPPVERHGR